MVPLDEPRPMTSPASSHAARRQSLTRDIYTPTRQERRHSGEDSVGNIPFRQGQQISATMSAFGHNYPSSHQVDHSYVILIRVHCTKMAVKDGRRTSDLSSRVSKHHAPMGTKVPGPATWHRYHHSVLASPVGQRPVPLVTRHQKSKKAECRGMCTNPELSSSHRATIRIWELGRSGRLAGCHGLAKPGTVSRSCPVADDYREG